MAIANSYGRNSGGVVTILADRVRSYKALHGAIVVIIAKPWESYARGHAEGSLDSSAAIVVRIEVTGGFVQRPGGNIGDLIGKIYDAVGGNAFTILDVAYATVGESGPWYALEVKTSDPLYNWPGVGSVGGTPFQIPVEVLQAINTDIWIRLRVDY